MELHQIIHWSTSLCDKAKGNIKPWSVSDWMRGTLNCSTTAWWPFWVHLKPTQISNENVMLYFCCKCIQPYLPLLAFVFERRRLSCLVAMHWLGHKSLRGDPYGRLLSLFFSNNLVFFVVVFFNDNVFITLVSLGFEFICIYMILLIIKTKGTIKKNCKSLMCKSQSGS